MVHGHDHFLLVTRGAVRLGFMATLAVGKTSTADQSGAVDEIPRMGSAELSALVAGGAGTLGSGSFVAHGTLGAVELRFFAVLFLPVDLVRCWCGYRPGGVALLAGYRGVAFCVAGGACHHIGVFIAFFGFGGLSGMACFAGDVFCMLLMRKGFVAFASLFRRDDVGWIGVAHDATGLSFNVVAFGADLHTRHKVFGTTSGLRYVGVTGGALGPYVGDVELVIEDQLRSGRG